MQRDKIEINHLSSEKNTQVDVFSRLIYVGVSDHSGSKKSYFFFQFSPMCVRYLHKDENK